jgi:hypothetical protein
MRDAEGDCAMPRLSRKGLVAASIVTLILAPRASRAQTTAATTSTPTTGPTTACVATAGAQPTVSLSPTQIRPNRLVNGVNLGTSTRPPALNPNGVNYQDCIDDMVLQFPVTTCNFNGQNLQIWASRSSDCTNPSDRGIGGASVCWLVSQGSTALVSSQQGETYSLRVQDIVGPENLNPSPTTMSSYGMEACSVQSSFLAVPININFIPINPSDGSSAGPAYQYQLTTDLVGPPPPTGVSIGPGNTLFIVNWTPNVDGDTGGYDVVIDPIPGHETAAATASDASTGNAMEIVCPDSGMSTLFGSGCHIVARPGSRASGSGSGGLCNDLLLSGGTLPDDGAAPSTMGGGIWIPPAGHIINPDPTLGITATGETISEHTVAGLRNFTIYSVVAAAVDNFGNVGPPSPELCDFPEPAKSSGTGTDGGQADARLAAGCLCALEAVGAPAGSTVAFAGAGTLVVAGLRRRRSKRRR